MNSNKLEAFDIDKIKDGDTVIVYNYFIHDFKVMKATISDIDYSKGIATINVKNPNVENQAILCKCPLTNVVGLNEPDRIEILKKERAKSIEIKLSDIDQKLKTSTERMSLKEPKLKVLKEEVDNLEKKQTKNYNEQRQKGFSQKRTALRRKTFAITWYQHNIKTLQEQKNEVIADVKFNELLASLLN